MLQADLNLIVDIERSICNYQKQKSEQLKNDDIHVREITIKTYQNTINSLKNTAGMTSNPTYLDLLDQAKTAKSKSTWFKRKAAIIYQLTIDLQTSIASYKSTLNELSNLERKTLNSLHQEFLTITSCEIPDGIKKRKLRNSKRLHLDGLPEDWRIKIWERMPTYSLQIATLALTGCRPSELVKGVTWVIQKGKLVAYIQGAKVGKHSGQKVRMLTFEPTCDMSRSIYLWVWTNWEDSTVFAEDAGNLSRAIISAGRRAFPKFNNNISAYSFRHQLASNLKSEESGGGDVTGDQISQMLGHATSKTKMYYGYSAHSRGGLSIISNVEATRAIKYCRVPWISKSVNLVNNSNIPTNYGVADA